MNTDYQTSADAARVDDEPPRLSVIVPVRNDPRNLARCLDALAVATRLGDEVIVVDDASTDETADVATRCDVVLIRLRERMGPAAARNRGVRSATSSVLFFVDADVAVQADTLEKVSRRFVEVPEVDALFGSYDADPGAPNLVSQYRNLLHHFVHQAGKEEAFSFWSGCGAIKRSVFLTLDGFDTGYRSASIEDIELGARLTRAGHPIALVKDIQVKHLKRWTLGQMIHCDVFKRGIPWTSLILRQGSIPNDLNLRHGQRLSALLSVGLLVTLAAGARFHPSIATLPLAVIGTLLLADGLTMRRSSNPWMLRGLGATITTGLIALYISTPIGRDLAQPWSLVAASLLLGVALLNLPFYRFLASTKGPLFALLALPLHVIYYLCSSFAFCVGFLLHMRDRWRKR